MNNMNCIAVFFSKAFDNAGTRVMMMMMTIMLMGWDYVTELWPPDGLLFTPQVIYEHHLSWVWTCEPWVQWQAH
jgi:hypothetical protein